MTKEELEKIKRSVPERLYSQEDVEELINGLEEAWAEIEKLKPLAEEWRP